MVTTYQAGKLVMSATGDRQHALPPFNVPMGLAFREPAGHRHRAGDLGIPQRARGGRQARTGGQARRLLPAPRQPRHGRIQVHEMAWGAGAELWFVNTRFSCLCTLTARPASGRAGSRPSSRPWRRRPLPSQRPGHGGRPPALRHGAGCHRPAGRLAAEQGQRRLLIDVASGEVVSVGYRCPIRRAITTADSGLQLRRGDARGPRSADRPL